MCAASTTTNRLIALPQLDTIPLSIAITQPFEELQGYSFPGESAPRLSSWFNRRTGALAGAAIATVAGTSLIQLANQPAQYEGKFQLLVEPGAVEPSANQTAPSQATLPAPSIDYATQIEVLWSPKLLAPVVQQLQTQYADINYETLSQKLDIAHSDGAKTLEVTYQDTDPQKVQAVLDKVSHAYLQYSKECRTSLCRELNFVEKRLPKLQKQVTIAQQNLQTFQQQRGMTEPMALGQQLEQRSGSLTQQRQDLHIRLTEARTRLAILQQRLIGQPGATIANQLQQNDRYQSLLYEFQTIANQLAVELARPNADIATLQALKQQYQQTSDQLIQAAQQPLAKQLAQVIAQFQSTENADYTAVIRQQALLEGVTAASQVQTLEISDRAIVQAEGHINQQIKQWAGLARQYSELNLELKFATDNLNLYQTKRTELRQVVQPKTNWQLTATPTVASPANSLALSDAEQNVSLGLLLCFLLTILVLSVAELTQPHKRPRRILQPTIQPEYSWQALPEQPYAPSMQTAPALSERFLHHQPIDRTTIFLLTAATRIETVKRMKLAA